MIGNRPKFVVGVVAAALVSTSGGVNAQTTASQDSVAVGDVSAGRDVVINIYNYSTVSAGVVSENLIGQVSINDTKKRQKIESTAAGMTVSLPSDIKSVYILFQSKSEQNANGCTVKLQRASPIEFVRQFPSLAAEAKANADLSLVVTAFSDRRRWGAPVDIRVNGKMLSEETSYFCNNQNDGGWEYIQ